MTYLPSTPLSSLSAPPFPSHAHAHTLPLPDTRDFMFHVTRGTCFIDPTATIIQKYCLPPHHTPHPPTLSQTKLRPETRYFQTPGRHHQKSTRD